MCRIYNWGGDMVKKGNSKKRKSGFKIRHLVVFLFILYIVSTLISQKSGMKKLEAEKLETEKEVETLQKEIDNLEDEIKNSNSLEFIEKTAREELNMVKPREIIYIDKNRSKDPFLKKKGS